MTAVPLIVFFLILVGLFVAGFFMNFYKAVYWGGGNFIGYGIGALIGYFLSTTIAKVIVQAIPGDIPFDFVPILQPVLFLVLILVIVGLWNLIVLLPIYFLVYRRFMKKHIESINALTSKKTPASKKTAVKDHKIREALLRFSFTKKHKQTSSNNTKKWLFKFSSASLMTLTFLPLNGLAATSVSTGIEVSEPWGGLEEYNSATVHLKDLTFTTFDLNANEYYDYVKATNAIVNLIREDSFDGLVEIFGALDSTIDLPHNNQDQISDYLHNKVFTHETDEGGYYHTKLQDVMQKNHIGKQLQAVFLSSVYQNSFLNSFGELIKGKDFDEDKIETFNGLFGTLDSEEGIADGETGNTFRLPSWSNTNMTTDYYIIITKEFSRKCWDIVYEMLKAEGIAEDTADMFASNLIHMFCQTQP